MQTDKNNYKDENKSIINTWPYYPNKIVSDDNEHFDKSIKEPKNRGVISKKELESKLESLSHGIKRPVLLVDFKNPITSEELEDYKKGDKKEDYFFDKDKFDYYDSANPNGNNSNSIVQRHRNFCAFMKNCKSNECSKNDIKHILLLLMHYDKKKLIDIEKDEEYKKDNIELFKFEEDNFSYIKYKCKNSGFIELLFSLHNEKNEIIAFIFVGQIGYGQNAETILDTQINYLKKHFNFEENKEDNKKLPKNQKATELYKYLNNIKENSQLLKDFKKKLGQHNCDRNCFRMDCGKIADILKDFNCFEKISKDFINSQTDLQEYVDKVVEKVKNLQKDTFIKNTEEHKTTFIRERENEFITSLNNEVSTLNDNDNKDKLTKFWEILDEQNQDLLETFDFKFIKIFGEKNFSELQSDKLELSSNVEDIEHNSIKSTTSSFINNDKNEHTFFDQSDIEKGIYEPDPDKNLEFFSRIKNLEVPKENFYCIYISFSFSQKCNIMALVGFKDKFKEELDFIQEALKRTLKRTLKRYFMQVFYINLAVFTSLLEHYNYRATSVMRHEVSQLIAGINGLRKNYFIEGSSLKDLCFNDKELEDINKSINAFLELLDNLLTTNKREIKIDPKNITKLNVLTEILFRWKDFIRLYAKEKKLQIVIDENFPKVELKADKKIIEPMIFNLLNNTVKYSLRDTVIHIKGELKQDELKQDKDKLIIEFINFSEFDMPKDKKGKEKIFELFTRGENIDESNIEGHGVGLWVISESAKVHKGKVDYVCNKISDYNISLIEKFIDYKFPEKFINAYFSKDEFYNNYGIQDQGSYEDNYKYLLNEVNEKRQLITKLGNEEFFETNLAFRRKFSVTEGKFVSNIEPEYISNEEFIHLDLLNYIKIPTYEIKFIIELPVEWKDEELTNEGLTNEKNTLA